MNIKQYIRKNIQQLAPYSTARDEYQGELGIYLDANENPYNNGLNRYPDPHQKLLKERLAAIKGVSTEQLFIGNGSDEPIDLVFRVFCDPGLHNAVSIAPTYGMYQVAAAINNVEMRQVALNADFTLDTDRLLAATDSNTRLLFLCSPNNPTANSFPAVQIEQIIRTFGGIVVLDEAYIDFAEQPSFVERLAEFPNLVVLQTLSKAWGMAGLRLGLALAQPEIVSILSQVKYPYNINVVTQQMVIERLEHSIADQLREIVAERKKMIAALEQLPLIEQVYPSDANFVLVRVAEPRKIYTLLIEQGIIVRDRSRIAGCGGCLRLTVGTPAENSRLLDVLKTING